MGPLSPRHEAVAGNDHQILNESVNMMKNDGGQQIFYGTSGGKSPVSVRGDMASIPG
jgi:hypothetical protein